MRIAHVGTQLHRQSSARTFSHFGLQRITHGHRTGEGQCLAFAVGGNHHVTALVAINHLGHLRQHRTIAGTQLAAARGEQHFAQRQFGALGGRLRRRRQAHAEAEAGRHALGNPTQQRILGGQSGTRRYRCRVQLDDEVAAQPRIATVHIGQVVTTERIGFDQQALHGGQAHAGNALLLDAAVADHVGHFIALGHSRDLAMHGRLGCGQALGRLATALHGCHTLRIQLQAMALGAFQHEIIGEGQFAQALADHHLMALDRVRRRRQAVYHAHLHAMQQGRAGIGQRLRSIATIQRCRTRHVRGRRETALHANTGQFRTVLPSVAIAVIEHGAEHQAVFQQRIGIHAHLCGRHVRQRRAVAGSSHGLVDVVAGTHARAHPQQVGDGGTAAHGDVDRADAQRGLATAQRERAVVVGHAHRAVHIAEARRRRIDHHAVAPMAAADVLDHQLVVHQVAHLYQPRVGGLGDAQREIRDHLVPRFAGGALRRWRSIRILAAQAVEHLRARLLVDDGLVDEFMLPHRRTGRQGADDVGALLHAACRQRVHAQARIGRIQQLQRLAQRGALDRGPQGVAQPVTRTHFTATCRAGQFFQHHARLSQHVLGAAGSRAGGGIAATAQHRVADAATGLRVDLRAIAQRVGAGRGTCRQRAYQRIAGIAGEGARLGHRLQVQACAQGIGQGEHIGGLRVGDHHLDAVVHRIADVDRRCRAGGLAVGDRRRQHRGGGGAVGGTGVGTGAAAKHGVADAALGLRVHRRGVVHRVGARCGGGRQRAHQRVAGIAGEAGGGGDRAEVQALPHRVGQTEHSGGARAADHGGQGVGDAVTHLDRTGRGRGLAIVDLAASHRRGGIAVDGAARVVATAAEHRVGHLAGGLGIDHCGVRQAVAAWRSAGRQRAHQRVGHVAGVGAGTDHATEIEAAAQRIGQRHHVSGARVGHHRGQGVGQAVTHRHGAGTVHRLGIAHARRRHRRGGIAVGRARGRVGAGAEHGIAHRATGLRIDRGGVAQAVGARHRPCRQRAHQRVGRIAGEDARAGHAAEVQAAAQRIGQGDHIGGARTRNGHAERVADAVPHPYRSTGGGQLGVTHLRAGQRRGGITAADARRIVRTARHYGIAHLANRLCVDDAGIGERVAAGHGAGGQRAHQRIAGHADEAAGIGHAAEVQASAQGIGQCDGSGGARIGHDHAHRVGNAVAHRDRAGRSAGLGHRDARRRHRRGGGAVAAAGGSVGAGAHHRVDHLAAGLRVDGGRIGQAVGTRYGARWQRAHQRIGRIAGKGAGVGHAGEIQAGAEGIGQGQHVAAVAVGNGDIHGVAHRRPHRHRTGGVGAFRVAHPCNRNGHIAAGAVVGIGAGLARCGRIATIERIVATADAGVVAQQAACRCGHGHRQGEAAAVTGGAGCRQYLAAGAGHRLAARRTAPAATAEGTGPVRHDPCRQLVAHSDDTRRHVRRIAGRHVGGVADRQRVLGAGLAVVPDAAGGIVALHHLQRGCGDGDQVVFHFAVVGHAGRLLDLRRIGRIAQAHVTAACAYLRGHGPAQVGPATTACSDVAALARVKCAVAIEVDPAGHAAAAHARHRLADLGTGLHHRQHIARRPGVLFVGIARREVVVTLRIGTVAALLLGIRTHRAEEIGQRRCQATRRIACGVDVGGGGVDRQAIRAELQIVHHMHGVAVALRRIAEVGIRHQQADGDGGGAATAHREAHVHREVARRVCGVVEIEEGDRSGVVVVARPEADHAVAAAAGLGHVVGTCAEVLAHLHHVPGAQCTGFDELATVVDRLGVGHHHAAQAIRRAAQGRDAVDFERGCTRAARDARDQLIRAASATDVVQVVQAVAAEVARAIALQESAATDVGQTAADTEVDARGHRHRDRRGITIVERDPGSAQVRAAPPGQPQHRVAVRAGAAGRVGRSPGRRWQHHRQQQQQQTGGQPSPGPARMCTFFRMNGFTARADARRRRLPHVGFSPSSAPQGSRCSVGTGEGSAGPGDAYECVSADSVATTTVPGPCWSGSQNCDEDNTIKTIV